MEIMSNIQHKKFGLNVRRDGPQPSIFVRTFSSITINHNISLFDVGGEKKRGDSKYNIRMSSSLAR